MTPIPSVATRGAALKYRYDTVQEGVPLTIKVKGKNSKDVRRQIAVIRTNVSQYGSRHGVMLVVRIIEAAGREATVKVVWDGRRK